MNKTIIYISFSLFGFLINMPLTAGELTAEKISAAYYKSYSYEKSAAYSESIKALQLVYHKYGNAYGINNRLGYLYRISGLYKNAESHYRKAAKALPGSLTPKLGLMYVYLLANNYDAASKIGYQVLSTDYYNYYGNLRLAIALKLSGKLDVAEKILIKMLTIYPSDVLHLAELGLIKYQKKEFAHSREIMQNVLILDPENVDAKTILLAMVE